MGANGAGSPRRPPRTAEGDRDALVYGRNPVRELLAAGRRPALAIYATAQAATEPWLVGLDVSLCNRDQLGRIAGSGDHQGLVARAGGYPYVEAAELVSAPGPLVCLDGAHDPRNLGAIARVAEGAGAGGLVIPRRGGPGVTAVVAKASAGAVEHLPIARVGSVAAFIHDARGAGRVAVGAHAGGSSDYREHDWDEVTLIVMGAEGAGLRPRVREACDALVSIPMRGRVASLNISVACGLLLYEATRNTK
jgi:23S rRNA (guanosine2251-2'-O)-methyltransferase